MKSIDQRLLEEAYQTIIENTEQPQVPAQASEKPSTTPPTTSDKTQTAIKSLRYLTQGLQTKAWGPGSELDTISKIANVLNVLSKEVSPHQKQATEVLGWLNRSRQSWQDPRGGLAARGFIDSKLPEELNKVLSATNN
jgi:hypothetical protein